MQRHCEVLADVNRIHQYATLVTAKRALGRAIDRAVKRINRERRGIEEPPLEHWHPYQLRHARAVEVREKYGAEVCQVLLGHSKIDMTQHYAGLTKEKAMQLARQVQQGNPVAEEQLLRTIP